MLFIIDTKAEHLSTGTTSESLNLQKDFLERDLAGCVRDKYGFSMKMTAFSILKCMQKYISHCVETLVIKEQREYASHEENTYCGMISLSWDQAYIPRFIYVSTLSEFDLEFDILLFDFTWTRYGCASHGMSISDSYTDTTEWLCGKRLPWTMIPLESNKAYIKLKITPYQHFKVRLFYSSQNLTRLKHLTLHNYIHSTRIPVSMTVSTAEKIEKYYFYVIANQFEVLIFSNIKVTPSNFKVAFYDGPGILSQQVLTLKQLNKLGFPIMTTTAFAALISLEKLFSTDDATMHITMQSVDRPIKTEGCIHNVNYFRVLRFISTITHTQFCYVEINSQNPPHLKNIDMYFSGPSIATPDSLFNCQYGGLFLRWVGFKNIISICDDRFLYQIRSPGKSIEILIVSYKGYTSFSLASFIFELDSCKTHYLDFKTINTNSIKIALEPGFDCVIFVCSSEYVTGGATCQINVTSEDGAIGSTHIKTYSTPALYPCPVNDYIDTMKYNITIQSSEYWPITKAKNTKQTGTVGNMRDTHITIDYLYEFNISLPYSCQENNIFHQLAIGIYSLECNEEEMFPRIYNNITELKEACFNKLVPLEYLAMNGMSRPIPQTDFIFTETGEPDQSYMVEFKYNGDCTENCRKFMYILKVWREGQRVYEYRSPVGQGIFTGCCHQGFRVTLVPPSPETLSDCHCGVAFIGTKFHIEESNVWAHGEQIYHLHEARYAIFH